MISYKQIGILLIAFVLGIVSFLIIQNILNGEEIKIGTIELIGFVSSIILSTASVVLAITAINLGKSSEKIMIERNDKSIEQQNQVFSKTIENLQRIESSTGVTEKRIEDIISGRAGNIMDKLIKSNVVSKETGDELKKEYSEKINKPIKTEKDKLDLENIDKELDRLTKLVKKVKEYQNSILTKISNTLSIEILSFGNGELEGEEEDLMDGHFLYNNLKFGVAVFHEHNIAANRPHSSGKEKLNKYLDKIIQLKTDGFVNKMFFVFNKKGPDYNDLKKHLSDQNNKVDIEILNSIVFLVNSDPTKIENEIKLEIKYSV